MRRLLIAALVALMGLSPAMPAAAAQPAMDNLHIAGNQILNGEGQPVIVHGAMHGGADWPCLYPDANYTMEGPIDQSSATTLLSWNVNTVRLALNEQCWLGINGLPANETQAKYQQDLIGYTNILTQNGIAVIIDLAVTAPGTTPSTDQMPLPDADHAPDFWTSVAGTFGHRADGSCISNNPNGAVTGCGSVMFELYNEPHPDGGSDATSDWQCTLNGGVCGGLSYNAAGTQSLLNAIRATGATNIALAPGQGWTAELDQWLTYHPADTLNPPQVAASWHQYEQMYCNYQACWDANVAPVIAQVPLVTTELGESITVQDCTPAYVSQVVPWLDSHNGGYIAFIWGAINDQGAGGDCNDILLADYSGTPESAYGQWWHDHLVAIGGGAPAPTSTPVPTNTPVPPTSTPVPPTRTPTNTPVPPSSTPTKTPTRAPTATSTPTCAVLTLLNGKQTSFTRPTSFCTNQ